MNGGRPVQQRSVETRAALVDAALVCLGRLGYCATSTTEISAQAGVSRGAQLHHFPTKASLMAAAAEQLVEARLAALERALVQPPPDRLPEESAVEALWSVYDGRLYNAWAELWIAARTDPGLAAAMTGADGRFRAALIPLFHRYLPTGLPGVDTFVALIEGLAFRRLLPQPGRPDPTAYLRDLEDIFGLWQ